MPLKRPVLDLQLKNATAALDQRCAVLDSKGVAVDARKKDSKWRELNARCRQIRRRIGAVEAIVARDAECERVKAERLAAEDAGE